jgi:glycosyltransferase involved in cell wall biosynthesis
MRVLIATDAWHPQVNGVVRTLSELVRELGKARAEPVLLTPERFKLIPCPGYHQLKIALPGRAAVARFIDEAAPDAIHIATEGPIGWAVRRYCLRRGRAFTSSYHTKFPEYASRILGLPESWGYALERYFHGPSSGVMVATPSLEADLRQRGFRPLMRWSRGVDAELFNPAAGTRRQGARPVFLYVGRVSREKNIEAFLATPLPGDKIVVGDGPQLEALQRSYPDVSFLGRKSGAELAAIYASADVFVFPSRTDTFGLVLLEAIASGLPVAAYPVTGPIDVIEHGVSGILDADLGRAALRALELDRGAVRACAHSYTWTRSASQFLDNVRTANAVPAPTGAGVPRRQLSTTALPHGGIH